VKVGEGNVIILNGDEFKKLCKPGEGDGTCIWAMVGSEGIECRYYSRPSGLVSRWNQGMTVAKRSGCDEVRELGLEIKHVNAETLEDALRGEVSSERTLAS